MLEAIIYSKLLEGFHWEFLLPLVFGCTSFFTKMKSTQMFACITALQLILINHYAFTKVHNSE